MLPFKEIWQNIILIQNFSLPCNMSKTKEKVDLGLEDFLHLKDEFLISTIEYVQNIDELVNQYAPSIDFTFRYKEDFSIERNWNKDTLPIPLFKKLNDILGMRFILKMNPIELTTSYNHSFNLVLLAQINARFIILSATVIKDYTFTSGQITMLLLSSSNSGPGSMLY